MNPNVITETIDELNNRMETALEKNDQESYKTLHSFYEWFVDNYIS